MKLLKTGAWTLAVGLSVSAAGCRKAEAPTPAGNKADVVASTPADPYQTEIRKFQQDREALLKTETGWLTIAGLFFLSQPVSTFGSNRLNDIVLPAGAPDRAGTFELKSGKVHVTAAPGVAFTLDGKPVTDRRLVSDCEGPPDRLTLGDLQFWVHQSGDRPSIRLRDKNSKLLKEFTGTSWFPVNAAYRVEATYTPYARQKIVEVPNILGDIDKMPIPGLVTFTLNGQEMKMEPVAEAGDEQLWFIFRDLTSGNETYPAARFLYMPAPVNGKMIVDFNQAQNPPCAYNPYTTCPLPPEQNRLRTRIEAGEKAYGGHR